MNKTEIRNAVFVISEQIRAQTPTFVTPSVEFFDSSVVAGRAHYREHKVSFNTTLAGENSEAFMNTIIHEMAHLVTRMKYPNVKQSHGPQFKSIFISMGGNGKRCHSYDVSTVKREVVRTYVVYKCSCREHNITAATHKKIGTGAKSFKCLRCGDKLSVVSNETGTRVKVVKISNKVA